MSIFIIGGSNSRLSGGYASKLGMIINNAEIKNLSVGAAPSLMGAYRLLSSANLVKKDDVVLWEYALNDVNHIISKRYDEALLVKFVEHTIRYCLRRNIKFVPLILNPLAEERESDYSSYRAKLHFLFSHYNIKFLDVSHKFRAVEGIKFIDRTYYKDTNHYAPESKVTDFIAAWVKVNIEEKSYITRTARPMFTKHSETMSLKNNFLGYAAPEEFENSTLNIKVYKPGDGLVHKFQKTGRIVGIGVIASALGGVIDVQFKKEIYTISLVHDEPKFNKPLFKIISLQNLTGHAFEYAPNDEVKISWSILKNGILTDMGFKISERGLHGKEARIAGLLTEEYTVPAS